jgi:NADH dehydrogenase
MPDSQAKGSTAASAGRVGEVPHVVIIGGGFAGLSAAKGLAKAPVRVTLVDRKNHHLFQPLLYQVATSGLSPGDIASPIRSVLRKNQNTTVLLAEVLGIDLARKVVRLAPTDIPYEDMPYDTLIVATGAENFYFGNPRWAPLAVGLKTIDDALEIRRRVLMAFEAAERELDTERRACLLTFVVVGAGPTGVELAGALAELSRSVLARDFREIRPESARIVLIEGRDRILETFEPSLSARAKATLEAKGVEVRLGTLVTDITPDGVAFGDELIPSATVLWAAGVRASGVMERSGVARDRMGRVVVTQQCTVPGHDDVYVIGDLAHFEEPDGSVLPGLAPVALQQGRWVAKRIARRASGGTDESARFSYRDKGNLATIGRGAAIAEVGRVKLSGLVAWLAWLVVHILYLIGFRNRLSVLLNWVYSYVAWRRGARLITGGRMQAGAPEPEWEAARAGVEAARGEGAA